MDATGRIFNEKELGVFAVHGLVGVGLRPNGVSRIASALDVTPEKITMLLLKAA